MEKKIEKVRQFYTALAQDDFETVGALLSDELVCIIEPLRMFAELFQTVVCPHVRGLRLFGIPLFGIAGDARGDNCAFTIDGNLAKYGGRTVRTDFASVDV